MDEQPSPLRSASHSTAHTTAHTTGRLLLTLVPIAAGSVWVARSGIGIAELQDLLSHHPAAPAVFLLIHVAVSLLFLPRTMMAMTAGLIFGAGWGLVWAALGSVLGAVAGFLLSRHITSGLITNGLAGLDTTTRFGDVLRRVERGGWRAVATLRLVPVIPHSATNYALGLTRLPLGAYALGSLIGQLPMTIAFVQFGAAGNGVLAGKPDWLLPTAAGLAVLALSVLLPKLAARRA